MVNPLLITVLFKESLGRKNPVFNNKRHINASIGWLKKAQDVAVGGGVAAWYSLLSGWAPSYIETTGYIISTFLESSLYFQDSSLKQRAEKMANFLVKMQLESGGYRTYPPSVNKDSGPTIFNTSQDVIGMVDIYRATKRNKYLFSLTKASNFLVRSQNKDGSWTKYSYDGKSHSYDTRVAFALIKAYKVTKNQKYLKAGTKNLDWAISLQKRNGWFREAALPYPNPIEPYTHTIAYTVEGLLFSGLAVRSKKYILAAKKTADALLEYYLKNHYLPGTLDSNWFSSDRYSCLTGDAQISGIWLRLFISTNDKKYLQTAKKINYYLKSCQIIKIKDLNIRGGIKGSQPIFGDVLRGRGYSRMAYINWAAKFFVDALLLEEMAKKGAKPRYI